jgi:hypothetical protein
MTLSTWILSVQPEDVHEYLSAQPANLIVYPGDKARCPLHAFFSEKLPHFALEDEYLRAIYIETLMTSHGEYDLPRWMEDYQEEMISLTDEYENDEADGTMTMGRTVEVLGGYL